MKLRTRSQAGTLAAMHMWRKKRWWVAQNMRHSWPALRGLLQSAASSPWARACRNSRLSALHMAVASPYCWVISGVSWVCTMSNSAPAQLRGWANACRQRLLLTQPDRSLSWAELLSMHG